MVLGLLEYFLSCLSNVRGVSVPHVLGGKVQRMAHPYFIESGEIQCQERVVTAKGLLLVSWWAARSLFGCSDLSGRGKAFCEDRTS